MQRYKDTKRRYKDNMDHLEILWYWCANVLTLGGFWGIKVIIKKAIIEAMRDSEALYEGGDKK